MQRCGGYCDLSLSWVGLFVFGICSYSFCLKEYKHPSGCEGDVTSGTHELSCICTFIHRWSLNHIFSFEIDVLLGVKSKLAPVKRFFVLSCCQVISSFIHPVLHPHEDCKLVTNTYLQSVSCIYRNSLILNWNEVNNIDSQVQGTRRCMGLRQDGVKCANSLEQLTAVASVR